MQNTPELAGATWDYFKAPSNTGGYLQPDGKWNGERYEGKAFRADFSCARVTMSPQWQALWRLCCAAVGPSRSVAPAGPFTPAGHVYVRVGSSICAAMYATIS